MHVHSVSTFQLCHTEKEWHEMMSLAARIEELGTNLIAWEVKITYRFWESNCCHFNRIFCFLERSVVSMHNDLCTT